MQNIPDYSKSEQYNLSIRLTSNGFSFYLVDPANGGTAWIENVTFVKTQSFASAIEEVVYKNEHLLLPYKKTELVVVSPHFALMPISLVGENGKSQFLSFIHSKVDGKYMYNQFRRDEIVNQFVIDEAAYNFLSRTLSITRITHYITPLLEYFAERSRFGNYNKMYINLEQDRLDLFCFHHNRLVLANSFPFQQLNDAVYFVLYAWEKQKLHQVNDELHICGDPGLRSRMIPYLTKYIQRVLPLNPPTSWYVAPADNKLLPLDLKTLSLCV